MKTFSTSAALAAAVLQAGQEVRVDNELFDVVETSTDPLAITLANGNKAVPKAYTSLAKLKTAKPSYTGQVFNLVAGGRSGPFETLPPGDYSAEIAADPLEGVYVLLNDGQTLKRRLNGYVTPEMFGREAGDADSYADITAADYHARVLLLELQLSGDFLTSQTVTITAETLHTINASITKVLDDTEAVRFFGPVGGGIGKFRYHSGRLSAGQASSPAVGQTEAHAFVFEDVILSGFGTLSAGHCAYSFVNDETSAHGLCWGNDFKQIYARGCVHGYFNFTYPGTGGHTENNFGAVYLNGKEFGSPATLPKNSTPIVFDTSEGFVFGTLNMEWTKVVSGGSFIKVLNGSNIVISAFHPEGLMKDDAGASGIFEIGNSGASNTNVLIENMHINNFNQSGAGTLSLLLASNASRGNLKVNTFSGTPASNTLTDFRLLDTDGYCSVSTGNNSGYVDYFTGMLKGSIPADYPKTIFIGNAAYESANVLNNPPVSFSLGYSSFLRLTGTPAGVVTNITASTDSDERQRIITVENDTGGVLTLTNTGNIKKPSYATWDITIPQSRRALISYNFNDGTAEVISVSS